MTYVGVDWAKKGWVAVTLDGGEWSGAVYPSMLNLWRDCGRDADQVLVDIPIGLPEGEKDEGETGRVRECDRRAREELGSTRARSVFYTPCREAVYEQCIGCAKAANRRRLGRSFSIQVWSIVPRIREVDGFMREFDETTGRVREAHPEVAFWALNDRDAVEASKQTEKGREKRLEVLDDNAANAEAGYENLERELITDPPRYAPVLGSGTEDDIVDAMTLAVTAKLGSENEFTVLGGDEDNEGLPMEIVYAEPDGDGSSAKA
jgi:predicted RNase H-like nuclease